MRLPGLWVARRVSLLKGWQRGHRKDSHWVGGRDSRRQRGSCSYSLGCTKVLPSQPRGAAAPGQGAEGAWILGRGLRGSTAFGRTEAGATRLGWQLGTGGWARTEAAAKSLGNCKGNKGQGHAQTPGRRPQGPTPVLPQPRTTTGPLNFSALQDPRSDPSASRPLLPAPQRPPGSPPRHTRDSPRNSPPRPTFSSSSSLRALRDRPRTSGTVGRKGLPRTALPQFTFPCAKLQTTFPPPSPQQAGPT